MIDPNKPIIDVRSTVTGDQPPAVTPSGSKTGSTPAPPQEPAAIDPAGSSSTSSSTTVKTTTTAPLSSVVPDQFKGSSNQDVIDYLEAKIAQHKPLSDEALAKIRRKQKIEGIISGVSDAAQAISNLMFTHHYAPNMYDPKEGMSAKAKARFEKEKAEREAEDEKYFNYALQLGKLKGADQDRAFQVWNTEQTLARQDRAYDTGRQDREEDNAFRNKEFDENVRRWQEEFDRQGEWHKEEVQQWERQFNFTSSMERMRVSLESQRLAHAMKEGQMTFNLGSGNGNVTLTLDKLNAQTVSRIYSTLPKDVRAKVQGDPIVQNGYVVGHKEPTTEAMLIAIGANVEKCPATQNAIKQVAGLERGKKPAGY